MNDGDEYRVYLTEREWTRVTHDELRELIAREKACGPKVVRSSAQIAANVVAKRRARNKVAKVSRRRNRGS